MLNVALLVFDQVSQNMEKMLGLGLKGASLALLDPSGFRSDLIQSGTQHFESVSSVGVITLSIYIMIYLILTTNLWVTHYCDFTDEQIEAQEELSTLTNHQLIVGELGPEPSSLAQSCPEILLHRDLCG